MLLLPQKLKYLKANKHSKFITEFLFS